MSPYAELIRLYGLDPYKERVRDVNKGLLRPPSAQPARLFRQIGSLSCWLGNRLIWLGQSLDREFTLEHNS